MAAYDNANPEQMIYTELIIPVGRNEYAPSFTKGLYEARISETFPLGQEFLRVVATDRDEVFSRMNNII